MGFNWSNDKHVDGVYVHIPLSDGQYLFLEASDLDDEGVFNIGMAVVSSNGQDPDEISADDALWEKAGTPIGPGGTEVFGVLATAIPELEERVRFGGFRQYNFDTPVLQVGAATERLFRIYEHFLTPRGYTRVAGNMQKMLEW